MKFVDHIRGFHLSHAKYRRTKNSFQEEDSPLINDKMWHLLREGLFILTIALAVFLFLALVTYHSEDPSWSSSGASQHIKNLAGFVGAFVADIFLCAFGIVAYLFPLMIIYAAWIPLRDERKNRSDDGISIEKAENPNESMTGRLRQLLFIFRTASFFLILISGSCFAALHFTANSLPFNAGGVLGNAVSGWMLGVFNAIGTNIFLLAILLAALTFFTGISVIKLIDFLGVVIIKTGSFLSGMLINSDPELESKINKIAANKAPNFNSETVAKAIKKMAVTDDDEEINDKSRAKPLIVAEPKTIKPSARALSDRQMKLFDSDSETTFPSLTLLDLPDKKVDYSYNKQQLESMSRNVELRLNDFGVDAHVVAVHPGPVVTRFELELAAGTKVSRITALAKDLARSLSVVSVRIVEVIPGKSVIGLELPNADREVVRLREVLSSNQYENTKAPLALALGKDISGNPVIVDLARMPHLLVAGTTGSGKSVCLNALLLSLLYKYTPKELRLIMIDPKMLELSIYEAIPHLLTPVVTNMKEAANALRWCVLEMERRYKLMMTFGVRNISGFNSKVREAISKGKPLVDPFWEKDPMGQVTEPEPLKELPYIIVIADEYADMIMVVGKKVEELIARIAQKARAAGIHLILATQRPSVDVITGLIKANIPARIAFQVSSKIDSRTILDQSGAEQLLGYGDMLYLPPGSGLPTRIHGAFVADEEVHKVARDWRRRGRPDYVDDIIEGGSGGSAFEGLGLDSNGEENTDSEQDSLYDQAVRVVTETRKISISSIQRRFKIGYNRAARIVEAMEAAGIVSSMESNGNREVLAPPPAE